MVEQYQSWNGWLVKKGNYCALVANSFKEDQHFYKGSLGVARIPFFGMISKATISPPFSV